MAFALAVAVLLANAPPALRVLDTPAPQGRPARVVVDAGHGALNNRGTEDAACEPEEVHTKRTQDAVASWLRARPGVDVRTTRPTDRLVSYAVRKHDMERWPADAVISIHADARAADEWWRDAATGCWRSRGGTGFAVLFSDEGDAELVARRRALADAVAGAMIEAGFSPYDGADYPGLYAPTGAGVFVDRHAPGKRIMMLRRTRVPFVIVETHQAVDPGEDALWRAPATQAAFAAALYRALATTTRR